MENGWRCRIGDEILGPLSDEKEFVSVVSPLLSSQLVIVRKTEHASDLENTSDNPQWEDPAL